MKYHAKDLAEIAEHFQQRALFLRDMADREIPQGQKRKLLIAEASAYDAAAAILRETELKPHEPA